MITKVRIFILLFAVIAPSLALDHSFQAHFGYPLLPYDNAWHPKELIRTHWGADYHITISGKIWFGGGYREVYRLYYGYTYMAYNITNIYSRYRIEITNTLAADMGTGLGIAAISYKSDNFFSVPAVRPAVSFDAVVSYSPIPAFSIGPYYSYSYIVNQEVIHGFGINGAVNFSGLELMHR